jgi:MFS family permease
MTTILNKAVEKTRWRLIPFMLSLYILAFLDRANIGFAKESYQIDTGLSNEAFAMGAGIFFVAYAFLGAPGNLLMKKFGAKQWIGCTTLVWGVLSSAMAFADTEFKFLLVRFLLGAAEAGFFPGMIYLTSLWFPAKNRASVMGLFYMGVPLALTFGSPLSGALLEMHGFAGHPGWFWMFMIEGVLAVMAGIWTFWYLDNGPSTARFLSAEQKQALIGELAKEEKLKQNSRLRDAFSIPAIWHLGLVYLIIQIGVYGLIFFLPTQVASLLGTKVGFSASLIASVPWIAAMFGTFFIPRYADKTGHLRSIAAFTLLAAGLGIGGSALVASPVLAIGALCFAAVGFIAVQPVFWTIPTTLLSGSALAAGIGFINLFGAIGGFLAPQIRVAADSMFSNNIAGLLTLCGITLFGVVAIALLRAKPETPQLTESQLKTSQ